MTDAPRKKLPALLLIGALVAPFLFVQLGAGSLENGDDAMFAQAVRSSLRSGEPLVYDWDGARLDFRYGPLHLLAVRASMSLLGESELALRLPAALAALCCLLLVALLAAELEREREPAALTPALLAALALLASGHFYRAARAVGVDITLAAFSTLAVYLYVLSWRRPRAIYGAAAALGLAVLTKGVLGLAPLAPLGLDWLLARRSGAEAAPRARGRDVLGALAVFLLVAASWHVYQVVSSGDAFVQTYFVYNLVGRAAGIVGLGAPQSFISQVFDREGIALLVAAGGLAFGLRDARQQRGPRLLVVWAVAALLPVLISRTRLPQYLLPALPAFAALVGVALDRLVRSLRERSPEGRAAQLTTALCAALLLGLFASNNLDRWLAPDHTPGLAQLIAKLPPRSEAPTLLVYNDYHAAARFYANRPTRLVTDAPRAYRLLTGSRAMREAKVVELLPRSALVTRLSRQRRVAVLTTHLFARSLAAAVARLPARRRNRLTRHARGAYVLYVER